jgi:hypothetical protein
VLVYRCNDAEVYRKSTERWRERMQLRGVCGISAFSADYHQQYLAKNPNGYCGIGGCRWERRRDIALLGIGLSQAPLPFLCLATLVLDMG